MSGVLLILSWTWTWTLSSAGGLTSVFVGVAASGGSPYTRVVDLLTLGVAEVSPGGTLPLVRFVGLLAL